MTTELLIALCVSAAVVLACLAFMAWNISGRNAAVRERDTAKLSLANMTKLLTAAQAAEVTARQTADQCNRMLAETVVENDRLRIQIREHESGGDRLADLGKA